MPDLRDWKKYMAAHPEKIERAVVEPRRVADLTTKAQMTVGHPGWQMFLDRLASRRTLLAARSGILERAILDSDGVGDPAMKLELRTIRGEMAGLDFASTIIPDMIREGEQFLLTATQGEPVASAQR